MVPDGERPTKKHAGDTSFSDQLSPVSVASTPRGKQEPFDSEAVAASFSALETMRNNALADPLKYFIDRLSAAVNTPGSTGNGSKAEEPIVAGLPSPPATVEALHSVLNEDLDMWTNIHETNSVGERGADIASLAEAGANTPSRSMNDELAEISKTFHTCEPVANTDLDVGDAAWAITV